MDDNTYITRTFLDLVKISSPSGREAKVAGYILKYLKKLKVECFKDSYGNVIAYVPGEGNPLLLCAHMDTVKPCERVKPKIVKGTVKSNGRTVLGADDKAGIAEILDAVRYVKQNNIKHRSLELVFTREEEVGAIGATKLDYNKIRAKQGLVLDACQPLGTIIIAAPFLAMINIKIKGKSAHAKDPEKGINAIVVAAKAIAKLKVGKVNKKVTSNIGVIKGGSTFNSVPEIVEIKAEVRSHYKELADKKVELFRNSFEKYSNLYNAKLSFDVSFPCHGYFYKKSDPFIKEIVKMNKSFGFETIYKVYFGGSDANSFAAQNIKAVTIAYGGQNAHTVREKIKISELNKVKNFLIQFIMKR